MKNIWLTEKSLGVIIGATNKSPEISVLGQENLWQQTQ